MKLLKSEIRETSYDIQVTETELGTIIVALGDIGFDNLQRANRSYETPLKIINDEDQLDWLVGELTELID